MYYTKRWSLFSKGDNMAKDNKKTSSSTGYTNNVGRPTGSYGSYGTSGYNGSSYNSYGRTTYSSYGTGNPQQPASQQSPATNGKKGKKDNVKIEKVNLPQNGEKMTGKEKKLAKKSAKFDETDLRNYPMTVGNWIGTFILLAIPLVGAICAICWFFGVGNKSRTAWARSYVVIVLLIVLLFVIIVGSVYGVLSSKAKNVEVEFDGVSYGTLGNYGAKGTLYYLACLGLDAFGEQVASLIIGQGGGEEDSEMSSDDVILMAKAMLAKQILDIDFDGESDGDGSGNGGYLEDGEGFDE